MTICLPIYSNNFQATSKCDQNHRPNIFSNFFKLGVEDSEEAANSVQPPPSKSAKGGKVVLDEYSASNYCPKLSDNEKVLALSQLEAAEDKLDLKEARKLYVNTRVLFRNFLFEEPKPTLTKVIEKFGKWLRYVSSNLNHPVHYTGVQNVFLKF